MSTDTKEDALVLKWLKARDAELCHALGNCESPIERLMLMALLTPGRAESRDPPADMLRRHCIPVFHSGFVLSSDPFAGFQQNVAAGVYPWSPTVGLAASAVLVAQARVFPCDRPYRLDFAVITPHGRFAIETDGHTFHERTKEQALQDKVRDRQLQTAAWQILRFTGSEVWADAVACVADVAYAMECERLRRLFPNAVAQIAQPEADDA